MHGPDLKIDLTKWAGSEFQRARSGQQVYTSVYSLYIYIYIYIMYIQFRLYIRRRATSDKCVNSHSAVSAMAQALAAAALPRRPRNVWFQQSSNESLVCYHCPDCSLDDCCQCQCCGCTGREQRRPRRTVVLRPHGSTVPAVPPIRLPIPNPNPKTHPNLTLF